MSLEKEKFLQIIGVDERTTKDGLMDLKGNLVTVVDDLPDSVNDVITLDDNTTYFIEGTVDLQGSRIISGQNTTILGGSSENCILKSTGLDSNTAIISSQYSIPLRFFSIDHPTALDLDATGNPNQAIDWFGVNFINCPNIGTIKNYGNALFTSMGFINSGNLIFDGSIGTVGFEQCLFECDAGNTSIVLPETLIITRRFRIIYSAFVILSGETGINVSNSATIPVEGYILDTVNFSGGGTYITGVTVEDNKTLFTSCKGIDNSSSIAWMTMNGNSTETVISTTSTPVKVLGITSIDAVSQKFSHSNNRLTYSGAIEKIFNLKCILSFSSGNNNQIGMYFAKNGTPIDKSETYATSNSAGRLENMTIQAIVSLQENDYIEIFAENVTSTSNITVDSLSVIISEV